MFFLLIAGQIGINFREREKKRISIVDNFELYNFREMRPVMNDIVKDDVYKYRSVSLHLRPYFAIANGFETLDGYVNVYSKRFKTFWTHFSEIKNAPEPLQEYYLGWGNRVYIFAPDSWKLNLNFARISNLGYVLSSVTLRDPNLELIYETTGRTKAYIYKTKMRNERFYLTHNLIEVDTEETLYDRVKNSDAENFKSSTYVVATDMIIKPAAFKPAACNSVYAEKVDSDNYELSIAGCNDAAILNISIQYSKAWKAYDEKGTEIEIFRANGPFMGIFISKNTRKLSLKYQTNVYNPINKFIF